MDDTSSFSDYETADYLESLIWQHDMEPDIYDIKYDDESDQQLWNRIVINLRLCSESMKVILNKLGHNDSNDSFSEYDAIEFLMNDLYHNIDGISRAGPYFKMRGDEVLAWQNLTTSSKK